MSNNYFFKERFFTFRLNRIKNKKLRFESYKELMEKCLKDKLTPNGLTFDLEPTTGNQSEEFVTEWYNI